eukprot:scaffold740_cov405-Prasinococcus_capsulatus_cf.AAC.17
MNHRDRNASPAFHKRRKTEGHAWVLLRHGGVQAPAKVDIQFLERGQDAKLVGASPDHLLHQRLMGPTGFSTCSAKGNQLAMRTGRSSYRPQTCAIKLF